jgi:hypothetical protein
MPEIVEMPTTVLASSGMPTAQYGGQQLDELWQNLRKRRQSCKKFAKKDVKRVKISKNSPFLAQ